MRCGEGRAERRAGAASTRDKAGIVPSQLPQKITLFPKVPHQLELVDINAPEAKPLYHARYKWDIPVIWVGGRYYAKHRIELVRVTAAIEAAAAGRPVEPDGEEPDSSAYPAS